MRARDAAVLAVVILAGAITLFLVSLQGSGGMMGGMMGGTMGAMALAALLFFVAIALLLLAVLARPAAPPPPFPVPPPTAIPSTAAPAPASPPTAAAQTSSAIESAVVRLLDEDERLLYTRLRDAGGTVLQRDIVAWKTFSAAKVTRLLDRLEAKGLVVRERHGMTNRIRLAYH